MKKIKDWLKAEDIGFRLLMLFFWIVISVLIWGLFYFLRI